MLRHTAQSSDLNKVGGQYGEIQKCSTYSIITASTVDL
jgi:hypothetical protein